METVENILNLRLVRITQLVLLILMFVVAFASHIVDRRHGVPMPSPAQSAPLSSFNLE
ncbi:MAG TPA: hypothetical protein VIH99_08875 [Bdellovibrionota bacterium]|jgi:hypothetical protein